MDHLGKIVGMVITTAKTSGGSLPTQQTRPAGPPRIRDQAADVDIPRMVLNGWVGPRGVRETVRALTSDERVLVQNRATELSESLLPFVRNEEMIVNSTIAAMLSGFRSMRQQGDDVEATVDVLRSVLREFPSWAILDGCMKIAQKKAGLDPAWPPNDSQVYGVVSDIVQYFRERLRAAESLLAAHVEPNGGAKPSKEEIEAKIGRPIGPQKTIDDDFREWSYGSGDGKHAQRVEADLAARRAQRSQNTNL